MPIEHIWQLIIYIKWTVQQQNFNTPNLSSSEQTHIDKRNICLEINLKVLDESSCRWERLNLLL